MISINDLQAGYGALSVLFGVSLQVEVGKTLALIGRMALARLRRSRC